MKFSEWLQNEKASHTSLVTFIERIEPLFTPAGLNQTSFETKIAKGLIVEEKKIDELFKPEERV